MLSIQSNHGSTALRPLRVFLLMCISVEKRLFSFVQVILHEMCSEIKTMFHRTMCFFEGNKTLTLMGTFQKLLYIRNTNQKSETWKKSVLLLQISFQFFSFFVTWFKPTVVFFYHYFICCNQISNKRKTTFGNTDCKFCWPIQNCQCQFCLCSTF